MNQIKLTDHFWLHEFEEPGTHLVMVHPVLIAALEELRVDFHAPIKVTSGYRGAQHNAYVGGVPRSLHLRGAAADLHVPAASKERLAVLACRLPQLNVVWEPDHLHVEVAPRYM